MLNEFQIGRVWEGLISAETRALYFGYLATRYTWIKQGITFLSVLLSSAAVVSILSSRAPGWVPVYSSVIVAVANAFAIAFGLDRQIQVFGDLFSSWNDTHNAYERLWNHAYNNDAESEYETILSKENIAATLGLREAPNFQKLMGKCESKVFELRHLKIA